MDETVRGRRKVTQYMDYEDQVMAMSRHISAAYNGLSDPKPILHQRQFLTLLKLVDAAVMAPPGPQQKDTVVRRFALAYTEGMRMVTSLAVPRGTKEKRHDTASVGRPAQSLLW